MGIVLRQSAKSTIILGVGVLLGALLNYAYTFVLEKPELGFITNIVNQAALCYALLLMGTASLVMAYAPRYEENSEKRKVLLTLSLLFPLVPVAIFIALYGIFQKEIVEIYNVEDQHYIHQYYYWLPVIIIAWMYTTLFEHFLISQKKAALATLIREVIHRACMVTLTILYFFSFIEFPTFVMLMAICYFIPLIVAIFLSIRTGRLALSLNFRIFSWSEYKSLIHFSWYHMLEGAALILLGYVDSLMLAPLANDGIASLSVYRNAIFVTTLIIIPLRAINAASYAVLNEAYIDNDLTKMRSLYTRINLNTLSLGFLTCSLIAVNIDNLVRIFPAGYEQLKPVVLILLVGKLVQTFSGISSEVISFSRLYKFNFRASAFLLLLIVALNRILIPIYGIEGAAWGATISLAIFSIAKALFLKRKLSLPIFPDQAGLVVLSGIIATVIGTILPFVSNVFVDTIIRCGIVIPTFLGLLYYLTPNHDLSIYIRNLVRNKKIY